MVIGVIVIEASNSTCYQKEKAGLNQADLRHAHLGRLTEVSPNQTASQKAVSTRRTNKEKWKYSQGITLSSPGKINLHQVLKEII